jgi:hypothetical protein
MAKENTCKTCMHFKCNQRELNYWETTGFCTNDKFRFTTQRGRLVGVYDKQNKKDTQIVTGNPSHDIETIGNSPIKIMKSRYCLQVTEDFGCIYHELKK